MSNQSDTTSSMSDDEAEVRALYRNLLQAWNQQSAQGMAEQFVDEGVTIGFDGSEMVGKQQLESQLAAIFKDHQTGKYVGKVKEVIPLSPEVVLLRAISGIVPPGKSEIAPTKNALQTVVARKAGDWRIALYQNTPAQFHGRPELVKQMTTELEQAR